MNKKLKKVLVIILVIIVLFFGGFYIYASDYYRADLMVNELIESEDLITVNDNYTLLTAAEDTDTALIFYPGAKVEYIAYVPILDKLRQQGITCILLKMPFNMAIFDSNAADDIFDKFPEIENWFVGGHSMGGAMASSYVSDNKDKVEGLILLGAYIYKDVSDKDALTIYGTFNSNLEKNIDYTDNIVIIDGGNHAQFGNYGKQKGDPNATITTEQQQNIAVEVIIEFIEKKIN
jgi:cell division protein YceG involved in septum cleavage